MADIQTVPTVHELLRWDAATAQRWIAAMQAQTRNDPECFNWHGLAEIAAADASEQARLLAKPRQRFPQDQHAALGAALKGDPGAPGALDDAARAWLDKAMTALNHARIAVATYHYLADREGPARRHGFINSAMTLRAYLIKHLGPLPGDEVLDPDRITDQFFADFSLTPAEARERATWAMRQLREAKYSGKLVASLRLLRRIKNALGPIAFLVESKVLQPSPVLAEWLAVRELLP